LEGKNKRGALGTGFFKKLVVAFLIIDLSIVVFVFALFHILPVSLYESWLARELDERAGMRYERSSFSTAFPLAFNVEGMKLYDRAGNRVFAVDSLRAGLNPFGHFGGVKATIDAGVSGGRVEGVVKAGIFGSSVEMEAVGVGFDALPALARTGVKIDGAFDAVLLVDASGDCPRGSLKARSVEVRSAEFTVRGFPLPVDDVEEAGVSAEFGNCAVRVDGIWVESSDFSARMKGSVKLAEPIEASPVDMTLELMAGEGLLKKEFLLSLLKEHRKSANYFSMPVKGELGAVFSVR